jgi:hypothetical protein
MFCCALTPIDVNISAKKAVQYFNKKFLIQLFFVVISLFG